MTQIVDGTSNTAIVAERPYGQDLYWGWWDYPSCCDTLSGAMNTNSVYGGCAAPYPTAGPYGYGAGPNDVNQLCSFNFLWGPHSAGGNFLYADGSVHTVPYSTSPLVVSYLATYAGNEVNTLEF